MSKQSNLVKEVASRLFPDLMEEVELNKITSVRLHKGIRVDFYIPSKRMVIEVHGVQHFKPSGFGADKVETLQRFNRQLDRDAKLKNICDTYELTYVQFDYDEHKTSDSIMRVLLGHI